MSSQANLALCNLLSRGYTMTEAKRKLNIVDEVVAKKAATTPAKPVSKPTPKQEPPKEETPPATPPATDPTPGSEGDGENLL